ncbi:MAG: type II toxin-antitoxin system VapC family toxin [Actinomycetota bacterium]
MTGRALFVDTSVLAYAVGGAHPQRDPCRAVLEAAVAGSVQLHASCELVQEFLFHRLRRTDRPTAVQQARDVAALCILHPLDGEIVFRMIDLVASSPLGGRDAVHAATALAHGFEAIVTPDQDFDEAPGLRRVSPSDVLP